MPVNSIDMTLDVTGGDHRAIPEGLNVDESNRRIKLDIFTSNSQATQQQ